MINLLLVEDDEDYVEAFTVCADLHGGYAVTHADRATTAAQLLREQKFDVVLLDIGLPDLPGDEMIAMLRTEGVVIPPIVVQSAWSDQRKFAEVGAHAVLAKPCGFEQIAQALFDAAKRK